MNIQTMSPAEVDTQLAELMHQAARLEGQTQGIENRLARHEAARRPWERLSASEVEKLEDQRDELAGKLDEVLLAQGPYLAEYQQRGGWPRYWLVTNPGGHVHTSRSCSSCYATTQYAWLTEYSGLAEAELVELAGERACSVCMDAPVDVLKRASRLRPDVEAREARSERDAEKARKAAEKAEKAIAMPDGSPLKVRYSEARTVVSAWREAVGAAADLYWYGEDSNNAAESQRFIAMAVEALSHKLDRDPESISAEIEAKAKAKVRRDAKEALKNAATMYLGNPELRAEGKARVQAVLDKVK